MPVGQLLVAVCDLQQAGLVEIVADQLQTDRSTARAKTHRHRKTRQPGQRRRQGVDIGQVIGQRIVGAVGATKGPPCTAMSAANISASLAITAHIAMRSA